MREHIKRYRVISEDETYPHPGALEPIILFNEDGSPQSSSGGPIPVTFSNIGVELVQDEVTDIAVFDLEDGYYEVITSAVFVTPADTGINIDFEGIEPKDSSWDLNDFQIQSYTNGPPDVARYSGNAGAYPIMVRFAAGTYSYKATANGPGCSVTEFLCIFKKL